MGDFSYDILSSYQFIDPSLLTRSSNASYPTSAGNSSGSVTVSDEHSAFRSEYWEQPDYKSNAYFPSSYSGSQINVHLSSTSASSGLPSLTNTTIGPSIHQPPKAFNGVDYSIGETEPQSLSFLSLPSDGFEANHEPNHSCAYWSPSAYDPSSIPSLLTPQRMSDPTLNHKSVYHNDLAYSSMYTGPNDPKVTEQSYCLAQQRPYMDEEKEASSKVGRKETSRTSHGTANIDTQLGAALEHRYNLHDQPPKNNQIERREGIERSGYGQKAFPNSPPRTTRHSEETIAILKEWYIAHYNHPYPSAEEQDQLAVAAGISVPQVYNWYNNKRSRGENKEKDADIHRGDFSGDLNPKSLPFSLQSTFDSTDETSMPGKGEGASPKQNPGQDRTSNARTQGRKRGKRLLSTTKSPKAILASKNERGPWPCTFCPKDTPSFWEWKRHEAIHMDAAWTCMPEGTPIHNGRCVFCGSDASQDSHINCHSNVNVCAGHSLTGRSFPRLDKLRDHIRNVHNKGLTSTLPNQLVAPAGELLGHWKRDPNCREALWCGFCKMYCFSWGERLAHVGQHLRNGDNMSLWVSIP